MKRNKSYLKHCISDNLLIFNYKNKKQKKLTSVEDYTNIVFIVS